MSSSHRDTAHMLFLLLAAASAVIASPEVFAEDKQHGPGVTDAEIRIGNTMPYSGPASAIGTIGRTMAAYWKKVNEEGGINGRRINFISLDDGYSPPKTVEQVRRLVEQEQVAFLAGTLGSPTNAAVQKYLNQKRVPQLFLISAASKWNDPKQYPWSMSLTWGPNFRDEGRIHASYLLQAHAGSEVAVLYQNDDAGRDLLRGLREGFGEKALAAIAAEASFEVSDPTVDSQIATLQASGAGVLVIYSVTPKACAQAIRKAFDLGWRPVRLLSSSCPQIEAVLKPAGLDRSKGLIALLAMRQVTTETQSDPEVAAYLSFMRHYYPEGRPEELYNIYAYTLAQATEGVLRRAGDDLTRENIMRQAASLRRVQLPMFLPGITLDTGPDDYATIEDAFMSRFDGTRWVVFGERMRGR